LSTNSYRISSTRALELADTFDAMSPDLKMQYPEMAGLSNHLRKDAAIYPTVMVAFRDEDCIPYPGAPDVCAEGRVMNVIEVAGRPVINDGYGHER
jgi:hypothetical protein